MLIYLQKRVGYGMKLNFISLVFQVAALWFLVPKQNCMSQHLKCFGTERTQSYAPGLKGSPSLFGIAVFLFCLPIVD